MSLREEQKGSLEVFYSYAHKDERLRKELDKRLRNLKRQGFISSWFDRDIDAGADWEHEIDTHLNTADIILLLISPDFIDSDYCYSIEMQKAIERHQRGEARVIPVILRPVYWKDTPFIKIQALPENGKPITEWTNRDKAFLNVYEGIRKVVEELSFRTLTRITPMTKAKTTVEEPLETASSSQVKAITNKEQVTKSIPEMTLDEIAKPLWDQSDEVASTIEDVAAPPQLVEADEQPITIQKVRNAWENVRKRVKQKSKRGLMAAYLDHFNVIGIEGTDDLTVIIIQAYKQVHYAFMKDNVRLKDLEWALTTEFGLPFKVNVVSPDYKPQLKIEEVSNAWENVRKRTKQKSKSGLMAAYLDHFQIVSIEGTAEQPIIIIQAKKQVPYTFVKENDRLKDLEWALTMEFGRPCQVQILPPH